MRGTITVAMPSSSAISQACKAAAAAESDKGKLARVFASIQQETVQRIARSAMLEFCDCARIAAAAVYGGQSEASGDACHGFLGRREIDAHLAARELFRCDAPEDDVGVGHCGFDAGAVTGGAGNGSGAFRARRAGCHRRRLTRDRPPATAPTVWISSIGTLTG